MVFGVLKPNQLSKSHKSSGPILGSQDIFSVSFCINLYSCPEALIHVEQNVLTIAYSVLTLKARAQGQPVPGQESPKIPYERQQLPKGRPGPMAGHSQMPRVPAQQYYPHVSDTVWIK